MQRFPFFYLLPAVGFGLLCSLAVMAALALGIFRGSIPENDWGAWAAVVCGVLFSAAYTARCAQKHKLLQALLAGGLFYLLLLTVGFASGHSIQTDTLSLCLLCAAAGSLLGGAIGALSRKKIKSKSKRRSSK